MKSIELKNLASCSEQQILDLLKIRNQISVRSVMFTNHLISIEEHRDWVDQVKKDSTKISLIVLDEFKASIGFASLNKIDVVNKNAFWAFYLSSEHRSGLGAAMEFQLINFFFDSTYIKKLYCEVKESNNSVFRLHEKFGFIEINSRPDSLENYQFKPNVNLLCLSKEKWLANKFAIYDRYSSIFRNFSITILK